MKAPPMTTEEQSLDQIRLHSREIVEFAKAATHGAGNRKARRRQQAKLKKMLRRKD